MRKLIHLRLFVVCLLPYIIVSCHPQNQNGQQPSTVNSAIPLESFIPVSTVTANISTFEYVIRTNGKIGATDDQLFICSEPCMVDVCNAQPGKYFRQGAIIAKMDATPFIFKIERAELAKFNGQKEYESQLLGYEALLKGKSIAATDDIKKKLKITSGLATAEQDLKEASYLLDKTILKAPFNGIIADLNIRSGETLKAGHELFRFYNPASLVLEVKLLESDLVFVNLGTNAEVSSLAEPDQRYHAKVQDINPYVDEQGMVTVRLKLNYNKTDKPARRLFPGMNAICRLKIPRRRALLVPKESIVFRSGKPVVFTFVNGRAKWNYVITGYDNGEVVEIKQGLNVGDAVITKNNLQLSHDAVVKETAIDKVNHRLK